MIHKLKHPTILLLIIIPGNDFCTIDICLTWKIRGDLFSLMCKVNAVKFQISIVDPNRKEQGFCIPIHNNLACYPIKTGRIVYNVKTNETVLTIQAEDTKRLYGNWTCYHGINTESAAVEVNVLKTGKNCINASCCTNFMVSTFTGFSMGFTGMAIFNLIIYIITLWIIKRIKKKRNEVPPNRHFQRLTQFLDNRSTKGVDIVGSISKKLDLILKQRKCKAINNCREISVVALVCILIGLSFLVDELEHCTSTGEIAFTVVGIVGGISSVFLLHKNMQTVNDAHQPSLEEVAKQPHTTVQETPMGEEQEDLIEKMNQNVGVIINNEGEP